MFEQWGIILSGVKKGRLTKKRKTRTIGHGRGTGIRNCGQGGPEPRVVHKPRLYTVRSGEFKRGEMEGGAQRKITKLPVGGKPRFGEGGIKEQKNSGGGRCST